MRKILMILCLLGGITKVYAQADSAAVLLKQGIELGNQKNYAGAIEKYKAALTLQPANVQANYQLAFVLFASNKSADAVPYIDKAITGADAKFKAAAYSLQGSIYGSLNQLEKSIAAYENAIAADSTNQRIYYNLGIAYYRYKKYEDAEQSFAAAIKRDVKDAGSARMYALSAFHQNKRTETLLGFCYFLSLERNSPRSAEAFGNLQNILQGGTLKPEAGYKVAITPYITHYNGIIVKALDVFKTRKYASQADLLAAQLSAIITALANQPRDKYYFWFGFADHFGKLNADGQIPAFARYISQSALPESANWIAANSDKVTALQQWLQNNPPLLQ